MKNSLNFIFIAFWSICYFVSSCEQPECSYDINQDEIQEMMKAYRNAWKDGDQTSILQHISPDIILHMPGKTAPPISSKIEVSKFWFPTTETKYPIINYEISHEKINGSGDLAYYQGLSNLTWCTVENGIPRDTTESVSEFTNVLRKENGEWKILSIIYNLKDPEYIR